MKIFMTFLLASIAWCSPDVSLLPAAYNYQAQSIFAVGQQQPLLMHLLSAPHHQQQPQQEQIQRQMASPHSQYQQQHQQQLAAQLSQLPFLPSQYLPNTPQQQQHQQQKISYSHHMSLPLPLPLSSNQQQKYPYNSHIAAMAPLPMPSGLAAMLPATNFNSVRRTRPRNHVTKKPIISKSFYIHSAPEESDEDVQEELAQLAQQPRRHYNVLFVKTPSQTSKATALNFAKTLNEERTVVYVLSKKTSAADLQDALADEPQRVNKPEVFFIKYRTPEEAQNAQRQIQSQYDNLGGSTTISDEGVAQVTSVVGSLDAPEEEDADEEQQQQQNQLTQQQAADQAQYDALSNNQYLPPSQF